MEKEKTIYDLKLHETLEVEDGIIKGKKYEITRVPGGWIYALDFPGWRLTQVVFVPFDNGFQVIPKKK
jgi:hypothetical protein